MYVVDALLGAPGTDRLVYSANPLSLLPGKLLAVLPEAREESARWDVSGRDGVSSGPRALRALVGFPLFCLAGISGPHAAGPAKALRS